MTQLRPHLWLIMAILSLSLPIAAQSQPKEGIPPLLTCQGQLLSSPGRPVPAGTYTMDFTILIDPKSPTTSGKWTEKQIVTVSGTSGLFSVVLGRSKTLEPELFNQHLWVQIQYSSGTSSFPTVLLPAQWVSVPYAFVAHHALTLGGLGNISLTQKPTDKQVLGYDADSGKWMPMTDQVGTGGGTGTTIKSDDKSIKVGGTAPDYDLSVASVGLDKIDKGSATKEQVLKFDGTKWAPGDDATGGGTGGGVTSVNSKTGAVNIIAGSNITVDNSGDSIRISATGGGGGNSGVTKLNDKDGDLKIEAKKDGGLTIETEDKIINISLAPGTEEGQTLKWDNAGKKWLAAADESVPLGTIVAYFGEITPTKPAPKGWMLCDGQQFDIPSNTALFNFLGTNRTPDLRGMFLRGTNVGQDGVSRLSQQAKKDYADPDEASRVGGTDLLKIGSVQQDAFQGHVHNSIYNPGNKNGPVPGSWDRFGYSDSQNVAEGLSAPGTGTPHTPITQNGKSEWAKYGDPRFTSETRPSNVYINWIIKAR